VAQDAGARGRLYFTGWEKDGVMTREASTDAADLGRRLFTNAKFSKGDSREIGSFSAGTTLHFAYLIVVGDEGVPRGQVTRTDKAADAEYFSFGREELSGEFWTTRLGIEDNLSDKSDMDYNDFEFELKLKPASVTVPGPGSASLALFGLFLATPRRKAPKRQG
jgi:hypothetical protein